ncbi:MAG: hypothetical protein ACK5Q5_18505 [Planctomycetaceae bacterium]
MTSPPMTDTTLCDLVNDLLVNLGRSLLQYAGEAWPWSSAHDSGDLQRRVQQLGEMQRESVRSLATMLDGEGHAVDFGVYPDEYTSLHYVSLKYLIEQMIANEGALVSDCRYVASAVPSGTPAADLLAEVARREEAILEELRCIES